MIPNTSSSLTALQTNTSSSDGNESNVISTSLIRETKSYHLLGVYDPLKNDEIPIKEAIARGILERQKGLYVHPITKETFSISDAINKGVIRAKVLTSPPHPGAEIPFQTLVSSNRFEENRTYTICGAVDPRTNKKISLSQAMRDGIIDPKSGNYVNILTGEIVPINNAIDAKLVLTEAPSPTTPPSALSSSTTTSSAAEPNPKQVKREIKTLNIEYVKDLRTGRNVGVHDAIKSGLLDRQSLNYNNPLNGESLSLNKAYEKGYIIGHYTDLYGENSSFTYMQQKFIDQTEKEEKTYFIIDLYDPTTSRRLTLDQAIQIGIFDHSRGVYIHPATKEVISIGDAVRKGFVNAKICDNLTEERGNKMENRLPIGDFGEFLSSLLFF
jgi:dystonin